MKNDLDETLFLLKNENGNVKNIEKLQAILSKAESLEIPSEELMKGYDVVKEAEFHVSKVSKCSVRYN